MKQADCSNKEPLFVIGYPKSGNTWLARLLADALASPMEGGNNPIDLADTGPNHIGRYIIHKMHHSERSKPPYITEHSKILYIVRDFRDVLVSAFFHFHRNADEEKFTLKSSYTTSRFCLRYYFFHETSRMISKWRGTEVDMIKHHIKLKTLIRHFILGKNINNLYIGNWSEHVNYWIRFPGVCVVKYEALLTDTYTTLKTLFSKMRVFCPERSIVEAVERQSFKIRKKQFEKNCDYINLKFMRKGVAGDWKRFLDKDIIELIKKEHGATMNRLGYEI